MTRSIPWPRIFAEGVAIVVSILLAFAIQAWWEQRQETVLRGVELANLRSDFEAARGDLQEKQYFHTVIGESLAGLLSLLEAGPPGAQLLVPDTLIIAATVTPTVDVATTHAELDMSASISSIADQDLRSAVVDWPRAVRDAVWTEELAAQVTENRLLPRLSEVTDLTDAWAQSLDWVVRHQTIFRREVSEPSNRSVKDIAITDSQQLRNDLAERIRHEGVIVAMIDRSIEHVDSILSMLPEAEGG